MADGEKRIQKRIEKANSIDENKRLNRIVDRRYNRMDKKYERASGNEKKISNIDKKYGYNYQEAEKSGIKPDSEGYMSSIGNDGLILKGKKHPSMIKTKKVEKLLGNKIIKRGKSLYSIITNGKT